MLDTKRVRVRIKEIRERVRHLELEFKPLSEDQLTKDERFNAAAERNLQVAIQACLDISDHIISSLGLNREFKSNKEVFDELAQERIIPDSLAERLKDATGYRNVVVHDYLDIDRNITYENIQKHLPDLTEFAKYIEIFLEKFKKGKG